MNFVFDGRGVSPVIGAILVFGLVVAVIALIQANAIPLEVQQTEYDHNQLVQEQLLALSEDIEDSAARDTVGAETVVLGTRHSAGFPFVKPGPASGEIRTEASEVTLRNVSVPNDRETADYWSEPGFERTIPTRRILYTPDYNQYRNAPVTVIGPEGTYNHFRKEGAVARLGGALVSGNVINLIAVEGDSLSIARTGPTSFETYPVTGRMRSLTVQSNATDPIRIDVRSDMGLAEAKQLYRDEPSVTVEKPTADVVRLTLAPGTYELRLGKVSLNRPGTPEPSRYVTTETENGTVVFPGGTTDVSFRVFDGFNSPVEDRTVTLSIVGPSTDPSAVTFRSSGTDTLTVDTDEEGRVSAVVTADSAAAAENVSVVADIGTGNPASSPQAAAVSLSVQPIGGGGGADTGDGVSAINPGADSNSIRLEEVDVTTGANSEVRLRFDNEIAGTYRLKSARVSFYFDAPSGTQVADYGILQTQRINVGNAFTDVTGLNVILQPDKDDNANAADDDDDEASVRLQLYAEGTGANPDKRIELSRSDFIVFSTQWEKVNSDHVITVSYFLSGQD